MYSIDVSNNTIHKLQERTFTDLGFKERENLQEWIVKTSSVFGEELLIIQKEFAGFDDTNERLDLLALDKQGNLVIIENKLDDSGRDVTWQALKYASYSSNLSKINITKIYQEYLNKYEDKVEAEQKLGEFFDETDYEDISLNKGNATQRIILLAGNFRKEVTSTALWLMNFKISIQCFRATPYSNNNELFLNIEQIIPTQDAEEYMIGMADKAQDEIDSSKKEKTRHKIRRNFWSTLLPVINGKTDLFKNISPSNGSWLGAGSGVSGLVFCFAATRSYGRAELWIGTGNVENNKIIFDNLHAMKSKVEEVFGEQLTWERLDNKNGCRIKTEVSGNIFKEEEWGNMIEFMTNGMVRLEKALKPLLKSAID
jgi:hypothetical protein